MFLFQLSTCDCNCLAYWFSVRNLVLDALRPLATTSPLLAQLMLWLRFVPIEFEDRFDSESLSGVDLSWRLFLRTLFLFHQSFFQKLPAPSEVSLRYIASVLRSFLWMKSDKYFAKLSETLSRLLRGHQSTANVTVYPPKFGKNHRLWRKVFGTTYLYSHWRDPALPASAGQSRGKEEPTSVFGQSHLATTSCTATLLIITSS